jgi:predicted dehydrogenase
MLKVSVVGLGIGLTSHIPKIVSHDKLELVAIVDLNEEKLKATSEKYNVLGFTDIYEMMDTVHPDFVVIASPTQFHAPHSIGAMERGIDVFLEKPMARNLAEAKTIFDAMERTGRKLMVYQPHRTLNEVIVAKGILESGILGRTYMITRSIHSYLIRTSWQSYRKNGGGTLNNHGSHYIDLMLYLSSGNPKTISCELQRVLTTGDADDCAKVLIKTDNDILLDIDMNFASTISASSWEIYGTLGTAVLVDIDGKRFFRARYCKSSKDLKEQTTYRSVTPLIKDEENPWLVKDFEISKERYGINVYDKCYEYYGLGLEPFVPVKETLKVMETLDKCHDIGGY